MVDIERVIHGANARVTCEMLEQGGLAIVRHTHHALGAMLRAHRIEPGPLHTIREDGHWVDYDDEGFWMPPTVLFYREGSGTALWGPEDR